MSRGRISLWALLLCVFSMTALYAQDTSMNTKIAVMPGTENKYALNIFEEGMPIRIQIAVGDISAAVQCVVKDFWGTVVWKNDVPVENGTAVIAPDVRNTGWYRIDITSPKGEAYSFDVTATATNGLFSGKTPADNEQCMTFAIVPRPVAGKGLVSIHTGITVFGEQRYAALTEALRLTHAPWAREGLSWSSMQPKPEVTLWKMNGGGSVWNWDASISRIAEKNVRIAVYNHSSPAWTRPTTVQKTDTQLPEDLFSAYRFMKEAADRYEGSAPAWELWNEPDIAHFSKSTPDQYAAFLKASALGLLAAKKRPLILNGAFARDVSRGYIALMLDNGVVPYIDRYNFHTYSPLEKNVFAESVDAHLDLLRERAIDLPVWITETGRAYSRGIPPPFNDTTRMQVDYLMRASTIAFARGIDEFFWFLLRPFYSPANKGIVQFGLLRNDLTPYPVYVSLAVYNTVMAGAEYAGVSRHGDAEIHVFQTPRGRNAVAWSTSGKEEIVLPGNRPNVLDAMGCTVPATASGTEWRIPLKKGLAVFVMNLDETLAVSMPEDRYRPAERKSESADDLSIVLALRAASNAIADDSSIPSKNWDGLATGWAPLGYTCKRGEHLDAMLSVYNFGNERTVSLQSSAHGVSVTAAKSVSVDAMAMEQIPIRIDVPADHSGDVADIRIDGATTKKITPLVFRVFIK